MLRAVLAFTFTVSLLALSGQTPGNEPKNKHLNDRDAATPGAVRLPNGNSLTFSLRVKERKGKSFSGTITYDLGLRETIFEVEGTIDEKGTTFQEKGIVLGHPHCPSLGGGRYEIKRNEKVGVAYLRLKTQTTKELVEIAFGGRQPARCEFVLGAFHIRDVNDGK